MHGFWRERNEIPEGVVPGGRLRKAAVGFHFYGMDEIGKFDGILDEEDRDIVADQVPVAFLGIKFDSKSAHVARGIHGSCAACHSRYPRKHGSSLTSLGKNFSGGVGFQRLGQLKKSMCARGSGMHDALGDALVIEMGDFFA